MEGLVCSLYRRQDVKQCLAGLRFNLSNLPVSGCSLKWSRRFFSRCRGKGCRYDTVFHRLLGNYMHWEASSHGILWCRAGQGLVQFALKKRVKFAELPGPHICFLGHPCLANYLIQKKRWDKSYGCFSSQFQLVFFTVFYVTPVLSIFRFCWVPKNKYLFLCLSLWGIQ